MLSWDLHVHPGSVAEGRWGDVTRVRDAAARAGVRGLVWKTHAGLSGASPSGRAGSRPVIIPSITLNSSVGVADLERALEDGVRWVWAPSRGPDATLAWDLPLPAEWPAMRALIEQTGERVVLATSHVGAAARREIASLCAANPALLCTVTHSLYLGDDEFEHLADTRAVFEIDLFTLTHDVRDQPVVDLARRVELAASIGARTYLTSDAGQATTGDPYAFVARELERLQQRIPEALPALTQEVPCNVAAHVVDHTASGGVP